MAGGKSTRRGFLMGGAAVAGAAVAGVVAGREIAPASAPEPATSPVDTSPSTVKFHGVHQPGIADPTPTHAAFFAFDLRSGVTRVDMASLMQRWTTLASALSRGDTSGDSSSISHGSEPGMFTMTVGLGGSALDALGIPRPSPLVDLPAFAGDRLVDADSHGDVFVQLCSNDAIYLGGSVRALCQIAHDQLIPRWQMSGFRGLAASSTSSNGRNLMGQIDGTNNTAVSRASVGGPVWVDDESPEWMNGGTYVVVRRFRMLLTDWESADVATRDRAVGRHIATGAPIGSALESDPVDLDALDSSGEPLIPVDAHIRLAAPRRGMGEDMLRRSYSYSNGQSGVESSDDDSGLIFVSYQSDPTTSFIPVQQRLAESDAMARFTVVTSSAMFAVLPGVTEEGGWYGESLFG